MKYFVFLVCFPSAIVLGQTNPWVQSNGPTGAFVTSLLADSGGYLFAGTTQGGIFLSSDDGYSWHQRNIGMANLSVTDLSSATDHVLFAATESGLFKTINHGEVWYRVDTWSTWTYLYKVWVTRDRTVLAGSSHGLYRSTDAGTTWKHVDSLPDLEIHAFAENENCLYAGLVSGYPFSEGGVYKSTDDGISWVLASQQFSVWSLVCTPNGKVYAGTANGKLYRSTDSGEHWARSDSGLPSSYIRALFVDSSNRLFVGTGHVAASPGFGIFTSSDDGSTWHPRNNGLPNPYVQSIVQSHRGAIAIGTGGNGVYLSSNSGELWLERNSGLVGTTVYSLGVGPGGNVFAGTGNYVSGPYNGSGLFQSTDNGLNWSACSGLASSWIHSIGFDQTGRVYVGTADGISFSTNSGRTWIQSTLDSVRVNAIATIEPRTILAGSYAGIHRSTNAGETWNAADSGLTELSVNCLVTSPLNRFTYAGTGHINGSIAGRIFRSTNGGLTWDDVSGTVPNTHIYALAVDSLGNVYAGGYSSGLFMSADAGASWQSIGLPGLSVVAIATNEKNQILVSGYDTSGYGVFTTTDFGTTWSDFNSGLNGAAVFSIAFDQTGHLLGGSFRHGVFRTFRSTTRVAESRSGLMSGFSLSQNYPNPFNPNTKLNFTVPLRGMVRLTVFDVVGRQVANLLDKEVLPGQYTINWNASSLPSGAYFLRFEASDFVAVRRLILAK